MASLRDVKNKIIGVKKTKQITKAMNMVASAKLRRAQQRIERFRPYADKFYEMLGDLASGADEGAHPLLEVRDEIKTVGLVVATSDRGLCGSFNHNVSRMARAVADARIAEGKAVKLYCAGKKARDYFRRRGYDIAVQYSGVMNDFDFGLAQEIGNTLIDSYLGGDLDEVVMVYGELVSLAKQEAKNLRILPIVQDEAGTAEAGGRSEYIYEPSVEGLLAELLPRFVKVQVYRGLLDTSASEHAARMTAMDNATRACDDMVDALTLVFNKTRQTAITRELMDIVGGAEALKG
ncbi:MAG: F0F1 ATP synthase subunit gamma [Desulfovibrionaceae bacterium]|nr:F0F1 ATP synthase subunit gamma [Desulfovibrionaceae bacterium]MDD4951378.1 F0F1 ATP synthase subunit gamma [Desulfovibrionaceae bacterium]